MEGCGIDLDFLFTDGPRDIYGFQARYHVTVSSIPTDNVIHSKDDTEFMI
jgi:hypothetical protein